MKKSYLKHDKKIDELLENMTLSEKIGQLNQTNIPSDLKDIDILKDKIRRGEVGSLILASSITAGNDMQERVDFELYDELQRIAVCESKNHIPMIYGRDVIHGHRTVYPLPLASAASFDPDLVKKCYRNIAKEAANDGIKWAFSPMLDISRDPRWGRIVECPGEDPYLGAEMAKAYIDGFQNGDISADDSLAACAKHYIGYGASEGGRDYHRTEISDYSLYNYYLPAFRGAVDEGVATIMSSFNDINGTPVTSSKKYLTDILKGKLGFEGFVVSDWAAISQLKNQGVASNDAECAKLALNAGLDMDMIDDCYINNLEELVANGEVSEEAIDAAVRRVLRVKFEKGLFENPYRTEIKFDRNEHLKDARLLAAESMVLLKNDGVLPLKKDMDIALFGPFVHDRAALLGTWTLDGDPKETKNFFEAISERVDAEKLHMTDRLGLLEDFAFEADMSDVVILALGETEKTCGENHSVADISLTNSQKDLIKRAKAYGKKVVGIFFCGRPLAMENIAEDLDAILYAWHGGSCTADAVCDILFGDIVPSGKTPITFPRKTGHIPLYYNVTSSGRPCNCYYKDEYDYPSYLDGQSTPYYPFGFGLSYTKFEYGKAMANKKEISLNELKDGGSIKISVNVKNIGEYDGKETVQLYIHDKLASMMRPLRELKGFKKVMINRTEEANVEFELGYNSLGFYNDCGDYIVEKGSIDVYVGSDCLTENCITIEII